MNIAKPHGSLNLASIPREDIEELRQTTINIKNLIVDFEHEGEVVLRAADPREAADRIVHPFESAVLVEPSIRKSYEQPWLKLQWRRAYQFITEADEIVVIGFSLPEADIRPRILLQLAGMHGNRRPPIRIIDPSAKEVAKRYSHAVGGEIEALEMCCFDWLKKDLAELDGAS